MARRRVAKRQENQQPVEKAFSENVGPLIVANLFGSGEIPISTGYLAYAGDYQQLAWVYASVFALATGSAIVPWNIWKGKPGESDKLEYESEQVQLFEHPNPDMTWFDLLEATMTFLELQGDEYWEVGRNKTGTSKPKALYPLRPNRLTIIPTKDGKEVHTFRFKMSPYAKNKVDFPAKDIIHYLYFNPLDDWYGQSTLSAAAQACRSERYTVSYNQGFFKRDATPAGYLHTDNPMKREQAEEIAKKWSRNLAGVNQSHKTVVLPSGLKYTPIGITPQDMQFLKQREYNREEILSVFGVPPVKVGLTADAKYCLPPDARVWASDGPTRIKDVTVGQKVWSFVDNKLELRDVKWSGSRGRKPLLEIRTKNRTILASPNHPFLVRKNGNRQISKPTVEWKVASELEVGSLVTQPKFLPDIGNTAAPDGEEITESMAQFLGAIIGDGTVDSREIRLAVEKESELGRYYSMLAQGLFRQTNGSFVNEGSGKSFGLRFSSVPATKQLCSWGFCGRLKFGEKDKRIPGWIFGLSRSLRLAFLAGLIDTDGHIDSRGVLTIGSCSKELAYDYRDLFVSVGIQCSNLFFHSVSASVIAKSLPNQNFSKESYDFCTVACSSAFKLAEVPFADTRYRNRVANNLHRFKPDGMDAQAVGLDDCLGFYTVLEIKDAGESEVYDIEVEDGHSFVADGFVVHNSNYQLQEAAFYRDTLQPKLIKIAGKLTAFLRREWGGTLTFEFDMSQFLVADKDAEINQMYKEFSMGALTPNQVIAETKRGEAYGDEGDEHYVHTAFIQVGAAAVASGERQAAAVVEETKQEMEKVRTEIKALMDSDNKVEDE